MKAGIAHVRQQVLKFSMRWPTKPKPKVGLAKSAVIPADNPWSRMTDLHCDRTR
jgi:hypothetical protein